jgi:hypothetical protein
VQSGSNRNSCERHSHHVPCFHDGSAWFMELRAACSQMAFSEPGRLSESRRRVRWLAERHSHARCAQRRLSQGSATTCGPVGVP